MPATTLMPSYVNLHHHAAHPRAPGSTSVPLLSPEPLHCVAPPPAPPSPCCPPKSLHCAAPPQALASTSAPLLAPEPLAATLARMQPGSLKAALVEILMSAGPAGASVTDLVAILAHQGKAVWHDSRSAKSSLAATCANDPAFCRSGGGGGRGGAAGLVRW